MICKKCGVEVVGNFCSNCGNKITDDSKLIVNNVEVDMHYIIEKFGKNRISAVKYLISITAIGIKDGKKIIDDYYDNYFSSIPKLTFSEKMQIKKEQEATKLRDIENKKKEYEKEGIVCCPKCASTSLNSSKKGFNIGNAIVATAVLGKVGLLAGNTGTNDITIVCLNCGHKFKPGHKK